MEELPALVYQAHSRACWLGSCSAWDRIDPIGEARRGLR